MALVKGETVARKRSNNAHLLWLPTVFCVLYHNIMIPAAARSLGFESTVEPDPTQRRTPLLVFRFHTPTRYEL